MTYSLRTETRPKLSTQSVIRYNTEEELEVLSISYDKPVNDVWGSGHHTGWFGKDIDGYHTYTEIIQGTNVTNFYDVFEFIREYPQPEPGVKYIWFSRKADTKEYGRALLRRDEYGNLVLKSAVYISEHYQKNHNETNSFTVEEIEEWGYNPDYYDFYELIEEPSKFIWVSDMRDEDGDGLILRRRGENGALLTQFYYPENLSGTYHSSDNYHLTEEDLTKWGYNLQGWVKVAINKGDN